MLRRLFVQVQKAKRYNLPGLWRRIVRRRTCVLSLHNLHGGAGPTATENWDTLRDRDTGRSHVAGTGNLGEDCVLLQVRDHEEERKRSRDAAIGEPWAHGLEERVDRRAKLCMSMWVCVRVCACMFACVRGRACVYVCPRSDARV